MTPEQNEKLYYFAYTRLYLPRISLDGYISIVWGK